MAAIARVSKLLLLLLSLNLLSLLLLPFLAHGRSSSVPELENRMYVSLAGSPCVRWLSLAGELGCGNPGRTLVDAPIRRVGDKLDSPAAVLVPARAFREFIDRVGDDENVIGVLVENATGSPGFDVSDDVTFPQAEFAPYENRSWIWNSAASGILQRRFNFPVFLLSPESTVLAQKIASENAQNGFKRPTNVVDFNDIMQTTKSGTNTSESCLRELSCLPLGGYSVMSTFPAVNVSAPVVKPVVVAMASMDSATFFRDVAPGADSPMSGVIALLAAVDALSHVGFADLPKRLLFLVFTGEARGYLGSRQFLAQLKKETFVDYGLTASSIKQVLEVGSVGRASQSTFFAHKQATATAAPTQQILDSLRLSAAATSSTLKLANTANPGIPPSSLMTFVHNDSAIAGVVLEEFDTAFVNKYYNSQYDDKSNVNTTAIVAVASLVARTLTNLASDNVLTVDSPTLKSIQVNVSLVEEMVECFFSTSPGMRCRLVESLMTASQDVASQYVGVFQADPSLSPNSMPEVIGDTTRFVWNFLADRTALQRKDVSEKCTVVCKNPWEVCVGATQSQIGQCRVSATRYVPAYSPRLRFEEYGWTLIPLEADDKMGAADPLYTESYWNSISTRAYLQEGSWYEEFILFIGVCVTLVSILSTFSLTTFLRKRLKRA